MPVCVRITSLQDNCPNLDTLDLSNCRFSTDFLILNVEKLQACCPSLRVLRLANCKVRGNQVSRNVQVMEIGLHWGVVNLGVGWGGGGGGPLSPGGLSSGWSLHRVVFHQGGLSPGVLLWYSGLKGIKNTVFFNASCIIQVYNNTAAE